MHIFLTHATFPAIFILLDLITAFLIARGKK
jgi:hypothetical protein